MHNLPLPQEVLEQLTAEGLYKTWEQQHKKAQLSHFFCSIDQEFAAKGTWEVGFFVKETGKITVFAQVDGKWQEKPADDVFKAPAAVVEPLDIKQVKLSAKEAIAKAQQSFEEHYAKEIRGDGFAIVQTIKTVPVWNFSFITKTLKFINVKINATSGEEADHQVVELMQK